MSIRIQQLSERPRDIERFLALSYAVYNGDPYWVAPLLMDLKKVFTRQNPLFQHAEMRLWVATRDGRDVGRIAGIFDQEHARKQARAMASFGFFECLNDQEASAALFAAVKDWARQKGCSGIIGPMNPTTNDECGLLIEGFDSSPTFMMTYNPAYYVGLMESEELTKAKDLLAFQIDMATIPMDRLGRIAEKVQRRNPEISLRAIKRKTLVADLTKLKEVYNSAWEDNWGFVPMTDPEVDFLAERLKPLMMEGLVWLAETGNEAVGFLLALPDYNPALKPLRGKLLTPKVIGFVPYLMGWKRPEGTRVITLGVKTRYRGRGLETAMLIEGLKVGFAAGFKASEASWILEDNTAMCRILEAIGGRVYKRYRIYERAIG